MVTILIMINTKNNLFRINPIIRSDAWKNATPEIQQEFISNATAFTTTIKYYINKYNAKKTLKDEFIAYLLQDFYFDLFESQCYQAGLNNSLKKYSNNLLNYAIHIKHWIKLIKEAYKDDKNEIIKLSTNNNGNVDLKLVKDISPDYRDLFY